ncbi:dephospho-CoA kinase [Methylocella tundrae]|jgi:dephospho-CoA kinase|uniref:Dephospho-CoA kinase n=1 Tax=Methylocella tundrae TaxID=227605 RepID=A0A4U8Z3E2_METTU|nr:dephospho-CoA kinase [Methylocella tundrae]WPP03757.1 dephospho-CoA kinase [Methylocella tundrae]VFU09915.1 Dephospho-CoA kinase [Methylocella tundrae]
MFVLGLTGSIGMGKTTTAAIFRKEGIPVHDSDAAVHRLYEGKAAPIIERAFPGVTRDGVVDRALLGARVRDDPAAMARLEQLIHPLVREDRAAFVREAARAGERLIVLDVPLLFETGADREVDATVVVSAPEAVQKQRVCQRPGMTAEWLAVIMSKQMPDAEKRRRAQFVIDTSKGTAAAENQVRGILRALGAAAGADRS